MQIFGDNFIVIDGISALNVKSSTFLTDDTIVP